MTDDAPVQAPTDIAGVAIHLSYIRRDLQKMGEKMDAITANYVPISVHLALKADIDAWRKETDSRIETLILFNNAFTAKLWGISAATGVFVGLITFLINNFK